MISSGAEAADRKQRIRDRYKGVDTSELEVIPAKTVTLIISRHSRDGNSLESMMMKASAVHHWSIVKECNS